MATGRNYIEENEMRKKAILEEEKFLQEEVVGKGAQIPTSYQNLQGDMESAIENTDEAEF